MKKFMLNTVDTEKFANLCNKHSLGIYTVPSKDLGKFFDLPYQDIGQWNATPMNSRTNGVHLYHCNKNGTPDGVGFDFWFPQAGGWYWNSEGKIEEDYSEMDNIDFHEVLKYNTPWTTAMFKEIYRRGDALSDWERGGNMNDYGEQELLDSLLVKIGCPDLATFSRY